MKEYKNDKNRNKNGADNNTQNKNKGFASMSHEKVEEIARKGGQARTQKYDEDQPQKKGRQGETDEAKNKDKRHH